MSTLINQFSQLFQLLPEKGESSNGNIKCGTLQILLITKVSSAYCPYFNYSIDYLQAHDKTVYQL